MMVEESIARLGNIVGTFPQRLMEISEDSMSAKPSAEKWSKKEILGHLIDSATNNHQRFVRAQFELNPEIVYDQNRWNEFNYYQEIDHVQLINFWTLYNQQLFEIIQRIPRENYTRQVRIGEGLVTLEFIIVDYVAHLEHHLKQVIEY
jgi:hypothetical protein